MIHAIDEAILRWLIQHFNQPLPHAGKKLRVIQFPASALRTTMFWPAKIRSISEEKFSSPPPSLPMPKISSGCASPCALHGVPPLAAASVIQPVTRRNNQRLRQMAELLQYALFSNQCQRLRPGAMRTIMRRRNSRSSRINPASSLTLLSASCNQGSVMLPFVGLRRLAFAVPSATLDAQLRCPAQNH